MRLLHRIRQADGTGECGWASIGVGAEDLSAAHRAQGPPGLAVDAVLDEADGAVAEQDVDPAGVVAPAGDGGERRAAAALALADQVEVLPRRVPADDPLVGRPGGGEARLVDRPVDPLGVARRAQGAAGVVLGGDGVRVGRGRRDRARVVDVRQPAAIPEVRLIRLDLGRDQRVAQPVGELGEPAAPVDLKGARLGGPSNPPQTYQSPMFQP